jgi:hypothetical protein
MDHRFRRAAHGQEGVQAAAQVHSSRRVNCSVGLAATGLCRRSTSMSQLIAKVQPVTHASLTAALGLATWIGVAVMAVGLASWFAAVLTSIEYANLLERMMG